VAGLNLLSFAALGLLGALSWVDAAIAAPLFSLLLGGLLRYNLRALDALARKAHNIADNPLSQALYSGRRDQFGKIDFALHMLDAETRAVVGRIADSARQLNKECALIVRRKLIWRPISAACPDDVYDERAVRHPALMLPEITHR
jgi:aerotaxis receptor